jgi:acyl-CoA reductase-like NAD-dependent aldehyde dehydrogenase
MPKPDTLRTIPQVGRRLYYGGEWHDASSRRTMEVRNPTTAEALGRVSWAQRHRL